MNIIGNWLDRVDTPEGKEGYIKTYGHCPFETIVNHELFHLTRIFPDKYRFLAILEYDGEISQIFALEDNEHLMVYSAGACGGIFNTDGQAFVKLIRECKQIGMWVVDNSPYDLTDEMWEEDMDEITKEEVLNNLNSLLKTNGLKIKASNDNVLYVRQL